MDVSQPYGMIYGDRTLKLFHNFPSSSLAISHMVKAMDQQDYQTPWTSASLTE